MILFYEYLSNIMKSEDRIASLWVDVTCSQPFYIRVPPAQFEHFHVPLKITLFMLIKNVYYVILNA